MIQTLFGSVEQEPTLLEKLKSGVQKTPEGLVSRIEDVISGRKQIDGDLLEELEYTLISADIGVATTNEILERYTAERVDRKLVLAIRASSAELIREYLLEVLQANDRPLAYLADPPAVIMVVGVNRGREDHDYRQTRFSSEGGWTYGAALRCRHLPGGRCRAA